jgi:hypothetical protein
VSRVWVLGCEMINSLVRNKGLGFLVSGFGFIAWDSECGVTVQDLEFGVQGLGFRVWVSGFAI